MTTLQIIGLYVLSYPITYYYIKFIAVKFLEANKWSWSDVNFNLFASLFSLAGMLAITIGAVIEIVDRKVKKFNIKFSQTPPWWL